MDFDALVPRVLVHAPMIPELTAIRALRETAVEFCRKTKVWQAVFTIALAQDQEIVPVTLPVDSRIASIICAQIEDKELIDASTRGRFLRQASGRGADFIAVSNASELELLPRGNDVPGQELKVRLALCPIRDAVTLNAAIADEFEEAIVAGALARALIVPGVAWSNPNLSNYHAGVYAGMTENARNEAERGKGYVHRKVRFSW